MRNRDLKALREQHKLSQKEFAEKLGISQPAISHAEAKPDQLVSNKVYQLVASVFGIEKPEVKKEEPMDVELTISIKSADVQKLKGRKAKIELDKLFTFL